ncbi:MAG: MerR family transcriptional regulator [Clostridiales bacterium]|nr:MerR family transcriptional regulator [Clostridiales bacterium]
MMTIKEFASFCGCSTQTLRYYDKIDLLKPVKVDQWSGYRYYTKSQAIDFVKIKNLQTADFTIDEIKALLILPDQQVYEAFDRKIAEQAQKLERIKEIQQSYLTEVNRMKNLIYSFCDHLLDKVKDPAVLQEFGMNAEDTDAIVAAVRKLLISRTIESGDQPRPVQMVVDEKLFEGAQALENMTFLIKEEELDNTIYLNAEHIRKEISDLTENLETLWEVHGWSYTHEFFDQIPALEDGVQYVIMIHHHEKDVCGTLSYPLFLIGLMLQKGYRAAEDMHCYIETSNDGQNHFALLCRK